MVSRGARETINEESVEIAVAFPPRLFYINCTTVVEIVSHAAIVFAFAGRTAPSRGGLRFRVALPQAADGYYRPRNRTRFRGFFVVTPLSLVLAGEGSKLL